MVENKNESRLEYERPTLVFIGSAKELINGSCGDCGDQKGHYTVCASAC